MLETRFALRDDAVAEEAELTLQKHHALKRRVGHRMELLVAFLAFVNGEARSDAELVFTPRAGAIRLLTATSKVNAVPGSDTVSMYSVFSAYFTLITAEAERGRGQRLIRSSQAGSATRLPADGEEDDGEDDEYFRNSGSQGLTVPTGRVYCYVLV